ncbi:MULTISPECIES: WD40 repeat domain-containing protein [Spirulina sp. CCY15215]|uniref:WD40 repeat domain-containing protein n=1 Tax=Spirulina sp. CCY15215 TaxID=2767591 RepID=UPI0019506783|nr:WD40 repeat domain-containing protein [Spirulina major]
MSNADRPRKYDAVLGSQQNIPRGALVLGGLAGVKQRWSSPVVESRIEALREAIKYGNKGLEFVLKGLQDDSEKVQYIAYILLKNCQESQEKSEINRALRAYLPYRLFTCIKTIKTGNKLTLNSTGTAIAYQKGKNIRVMNLDREETLYTIPKSAMREMYALCPDADILVRVKNSIHRNSPEIEIWDRGELKHSLYGHQLDITVIAIAPDGKILATGCEDGSIRLWQMATGKLLGNFSTHLIFGSHNSAVSHLAFSADGHTLVSTAQDSTIKLWDLRTRDRPYTLKLFSSYALLSPVGLILAAIAWQGKIQLWELNLEKKTNHAFCTFDDRTYSTSVLTFSPYGRILLSGGRDGKISFWDVYGRSQFHELSGHESAIDSLVLNSSGDRLISTDRGKVIKIWEVR